MHYCEFSTATYKREYFVIVKFFYLCRCSLFVFVVINKNVSTQWDPSAFVSREKCTHASNLDIYMYVYVFFLQFHCFDLKVKVIRDISFQKTLNNKRMWSHLIVWIILRLSCRYNCIHVVNSQRKPRSMIFRAVRVSNNKKSLAL